MRFVRERALRQPLLLFIALMAVTVTWAVATPRFAAPDEPAHIYKAYGTAHGELLGKKAPGFPDNLREFDGPDALGPPNLECYNGQPDVPAACATQISPRLISTAARYPPWYYALVGLPVAVSGEADRVWPYRLVSGFLCVVLLVFGAVIAKRSRRSALVGLQLAVLTPMALFLIGSVNPNAMEIALFVCVWACLTRVATDPELPGGLLIFASILSAVVVVMRPVAIVWMAGVALVAALATPRSRLRELATRRWLAWLVGPTALALVASWVWLRYSSFQIKDERNVNALTLTDALRKSVESWGGYVKQSIGLLGWLDTFLPTWVYVIWVVAFVLVAVVFIGGAVPRTTLAFGALLAVWLALPLLINGFTNSRAGLTYQGRYGLPVLVGLAFMPLFNERRLRVSADVQRRIVVAVSAIAVVGEVAALWQLLRRYTVGADGKIVLTGSLPWEPPVAPLVLIAVNAVAMMGVAVLLVRTWPEVTAESV